MKISNSICQIHNLEEAKLAYAEAVAEIKKKADLLHQLDEEREAAIAKIYARLKRTNKRYENKERKIEKEIKKAYEGIIRGLENLIRSKPEEMRRNMKELRRMKDVLEKIGDEAHCGNPFTIWGLRLLCLSDVLREVIREKSKGEAQKNVRAKP